MQKLQLVGPTAVSLPALFVFVLFILAARQHRSFLDSYRSGLASISSSGSWHPEQAENSRSAFARVPKGCDIFRGEWVPDDGGAPYYTNRSCPLIQEHQNCMKYGRPDLGFLSWRWRPAQCELPRFDAAAFLGAVKGRSMAFVGDSLARNHMQSLMCLLSKLEYPKDISTTKNQEFRTLHYESYNFTISTFWSPFLVKANQSDSDYGSGRLWNLYLDEPDDAWLPGVAGADYLVISAANWFTRPSLFYESGRLVACHYCLVPGVPDLTLRHSQRVAFRTVLRALTSHRGFNGTAIVRTVSPTHFEGGEWNKGGDCRRTRPYAANETRMAGLHHDFHTAQVEEFARAEEAAARRRGGGGARLVLMDTTAAMLLRPDGHPSRYGHWAHENVTLYKDCVHWCLPGPIDVWNEMLLQLEYPKDISTTKNQEFRTRHYESYNFTISTFWSPFLVKANQSDSDYGSGRLWNLYLDEPDDAWLPGVAGADYLVISAANWFTRPSLFYESGRLVACHYCLVPGVPDLTLRHSQRVAFRTVLRALTSHRGFNGTAIVRTVLPTHFEGGEWNKGGDCRRTRPYAANETRMAGLHHDFHTAQVEEFARAEEAAARRRGGGGARLVLMDTTAAMLLRPDGHPSRYGHWAHENVTLYKDCVHWCLPGPIDVWNEMLLQAVHA